MPICVRREYWVVAVLDFDDSTLTIYDTDDTDAITRPLKTLLGSFRNRLNSFLRRLGETSRAENVRNISYLFADNVIKSTVKADSGPLACQIISLLGHGQIPSMETMTLTPIQSRYNVADMLWAYVSD